MSYTSREVYEFISKKTYDPIVERKTCRVSGTEFPIYQSDLDFYAKISPTFDGKKFQITTPTLCPEERQRRRLSFRNERKLYKRMCDATGENIISIYSPDKKIKVYSAKVRRLDIWNEMDFGMDFDFNRSFTEQYTELMSKVPMPSRTAEEATMFNSDYCNEAGNLKDCYLCIEAGICQNCMYSRGLLNTNNTIDCLNCDDCELCYMCVEVKNCYMCFYSDHCNDSKYLIQCSSCINCSNCYGSTNLIGKQYCINNVQYTKKEYEIYVKGDFFFQQQYGVLKQNHNNQNESSIGEYLLNTKNSILCYSCTQTEQCRYCDFLLGGGDNYFSYDVSNFGIGIDHCYESECIGGNPGNCKNVLFSSKCWPGSSLLYCYMNVSGCHNNFGCIGLRNKSYCIFNKQFSKEAYEIQVAKIIAHMQSTGERGEFFDPSLSSFGYNETVAQEYFPMSQEQATQGGYKRQTINYDPVIPAGIQILTEDQIPADITTVTDDILKSIFVCEVSGRPFRIIKQELDFYRKHNLPLPRKHPDVRHEERMKLRPGRTLYLRTCDCCAEEMLSVYPAEYIGKVNCEDCYKKEIYS